MPSEWESEPPRRASWAEVVGEANAAPFISTAGAIVV
jgi:hypothetical protein